MPGCNPKLQQFTIFCSLILASLVATAKIALSASFDCSSVTNPTEEKICSYGELSALDQIMAKAYQRAPDIVGWISVEELREAQRNWIIQRNSCADDIGCIYKSYVDRIAEISVGTIELKANDNVTSFIYEGEPVDGICEIDQTLSDWGQCVSLMPAGASFRGFSSDGQLAFDYFYIGSNGHMCNASGLAQKSGNSWIYSDTHYDCKISISISADGLLLSPTEQCNVYCGMRAYGGIDRLIEY